MYDEDLAIVLGILGFTAFIFIMVIAILIGTILLLGIPLYKMAKNRGEERPWLAFIPFGNTYLLIKLGNKNIRLLDLALIECESNPGVGLVAVIIVSLVQGTVTAIPMIGWIGSIICAVATIVMMMGVWKNLLEYYEEPGKVKTSSLISALLGIGWIYLFKYMNAPIKYPKEYTENQYMGAKAPQYIIDKNGIRRNTVNTYNQPTGGYYEQQNNQGYYENGYEQTNNNYGASVDLNKHD